MKEEQIQKEFNGQRVVLYPYGTGPDGLEVWCSGQMIDGMVMVRLARGQGEALAIIPGIWWVEHKGFPDGDRAALERYLKENARALCHFALDQYFEHSSDVDLELEPETVERITRDSAALGDSPQRYMQRLLYDALEKKGEEKEWEALPTILANWIFRKKNGPSTPGKP